MRFLIACAAATLLLTPSRAFAGDSADPLRDCTIEPRDRGAYVLCGDVRITVEDPRTEEDSQRIRERMESFAAGDVEAQRLSVEQKPFTFAGVRSHEAGGRLTRMVTVAIGPAIMRFLECVALGVPHPTPTEDPCQPLVMRVGRYGAGKLGPPNPFRAMARAARAGRTTPTDAAAAAPAPPTPAKRDDSLTAGFVEAAPAAAPSPAGPSTVVVFDAELGDKEQQAAIAAITPKPVVDASEIWPSVAELSALRLGNLDAARRPLGWPAELGSVWDDAIAACRIRAGGPPYDMKNRGAFLCGSQAASALWQRYLESVKAARVVVLSTARNSQGELLGIDAETYEPESTKTRKFSYGIARGDPAVQAVRLAVRAILAGEGREEARTFERELPAAPAGSAPVPEGESYDLAALPVPAGCSPPAITFEPANDPFVQTVAKRWAKTAGDGASPALRCTVAVDELPGSAALGGLGNAMMTFKARLTCGDATYRSKGVLHVSRWKRSPQDQLSAGILKELLAASCR